MLLLALKLMNSVCPYPYAAKKIGSENFGNNFWNRQSFFSQVFLKRAFTIPSYPQSFFSIC